MGMKSSPINNDIRHAFAVGDTEASRLLHDYRANMPHDEAHNSLGDYLKGVVFGGLDGILTSFAIVAGAAGGKMSWEVVLVLGFSNIFADAISMGVGEYLSSQAHNEYVSAERRREEWELKNHREGEITEMVDVFTKRGLSTEDANIFVTTIAKYDQVFIDFMMTEELGLQVDDDGASTIRDGFLMFLAFGIFGSFPLIGYVVFPLIDPDIGDRIMFILACIVTALSLFFLGAIKASFSSRRWYMSGMEMVLLGGCCAAIAYGIGAFVNSLVY